MLPKTEFLKAASDDLLRILDSVSTEVEVPTRTVLFSEFDEGDALYIVKDGAIEISTLSEDGRKLGLEIMRAGAVFGEIALFDPGPRTATATAMETTKLLQVRNSDMLKEIHHRPELSVELLRLAGSRMRWMNMQLHEYVFLALPARLARKVLHLTINRPGPAETFNLSQTDLADFTGATREAVSKTMSVWKHKGIIETGRGKLAILDRPALQQIAGLEPE